MSRCKPEKFSTILLLAVLLVMAACGSPPQSTQSGRFAGMAIPENATGSSSIAVTSVTLNPAQLTGGGSSAITIRLTAAAPNGGVTVQLANSDGKVVTTPATVTIPAGQSSATATATTTAVNTQTAVAISAIYNNTVASAVLTINSATSAPFSVTLQPSTLTKAPGQSASVKITTKISSGYDHSLQLKASNLPTGVSVTFTPSTIPAPGAGTSNPTITLPADIQPGTHSIHLTATDGTTFENATLTLKVDQSPGATFQGCWYKKNGHRYQGVQISVANPGTYPFDADLYFGTTCDPNQQADEFGFGIPLKFGGFGYIFWFSDFADQSNMSAIWHVGTDHSQCVNYKVAPNCQ